MFTNKFTITKNNNIINTFKLNKIPPTFYKIPQIKINFNIDTNKIINITTRNKNTKKSNQITISKNKLNPNKLNNIKNKTIKYQKKNKLKNQKIKHKNHLKSYLIFIQKYTQFTKKTLNNQKLQSLSLLYNKTFS